VQDCCEFITGNDGPVMSESLIGVHHPRKIDPRCGIRDERLLSPLSDHYSECGRSNYVEVSGRLRCRHIVVQRVVGADREREFPQVFPPHLIGCSGRVLTSREIGVEAHGAN